MLNENVRESCGSITVKNMIKSPREIEVSGDFILPDMHSDIKRILHTSANIRPENLYYDDGKIEYEGAVYCKVVFLNEEGNIRSINYTLDYNGFGDTEELGVQNVFSCPQLISVTTKTLNPRKLQLKAKISPYVKSFSEIPAEPELSINTEGQYEEDFEMLKESLSCTSVKVYSEKAIGVSEDIVIPIEKAAVRDISFSSANIVIEKTVCAEDSISVSGKAYINIIYTYDEEQQERSAFIKKTVPVSYTFDAPDVNSECDAVSFAYSYNPTVLVNEDSNGEDRIIELDFTYDVYSIVFCGCNVSAVTDMYSTSLVTENITATPNIVSSASVKYGSINKTWNANNKNAKEINGVFVVPSVESLNYSEEKGKYILTGNSQINVITLTDDNNYTLFQGRDPFEIEIDIPANSNIDYVANVFNTDAVGKISDNGIVVDYTLYYDVFVWNEDKKELISGVNLSDNNIIEDNSPITIYYPENNESLWDISKKFKVKQNSVRKANPDNDFTENSFPVLVPKKIFGTKVSKQ